MAFFMEQQSPRKLKPGLFMFDCSSNPKAGTTAPASQPSKKEWKYMENVTPILSFFSGEFHRLVHVSYFIIYEKVCSCNKYIQQYISKFSKRSDLKYDHTSC